MYGGVVAALVVDARATGRRAPERVSPWDVALFAAATYKLSRLVP
ncbi:MAG: hypothetical protein ABJA34_06110 [Pseudonocardiales bacterium]